MQEKLAPTHYYINPIQDRYEFLRSDIVLSMISDKSGDWWKEFHFIRMATTSFERDQYESEINEINLSLGMVSIDITLIYFASSNKLSQNKIDSF